MSDAVSLSDAGEVVDEFVERRVTASKTDSRSGAERYARDVRNCWLPFLRNERDTSPWRADSGDAYAYFRNLVREGYADKTIRLRQTSVSMFYREIWKMHDQEQHSFPDSLADALAEADERAEFNPVAGMELGRDFGVTTESKKSKNVPDDIVYLSPEEVRKLEENVPAPRSRNVLIIRLLYNTGMRRGELARLKLSDVDRENRVIHVPGIKGDESGRQNKYSPSTESLFINYLDRGGRDSIFSAPESEYLFPTEQREYIRPQNVNRQVVRKAAKRHDEQAPPGEQIQETIATSSDGREIKRITAHALRHSYGCRAIDSGIGVYKVMELMGHEKIETTQVYLHHASKDLLQDAERFDLGF